ncbi:MAG: oxidation resistance protein 1 [Candelina mexicana]|nr:MAG: oxidation resistance protein 1 [Candelina mexicana]
MSDSIATNRRMSRLTDHRDTPLTSSPPPPSAPGTSPSTNSYLTFPINYTVSGLLRRLTDPLQELPAMPSLPHLPALPPAIPNQQQIDLLSADNFPSEKSSGTYTPPRRHLSPFQSPPLTPLTLKGVKPSTTASAQILSRALAEEIRLLVPARLELVDEWNLVYSVEQDGVSLATLYKRCDAYRGKRTGFVLVVRDGSGGIFGAYLTDAPQPQPHYYGTGECFLWRASILPSLDLLSSLPPPPSADTTNMQRSTTISAQKGTLGAPPPCGQGASGTSTPDRIRFKAFPYSGVNDYMMFCEPGFLSVGGGDGHYGLWLDDVFEKGISSSCPTFGNEPLSDEGTKFDVLGVEVWHVGA